MTKPTASEVRAEINKVFGEDTMRLASDPYHAVSYMKTGVLPVDYLIGGIPRGRFVEFYGDYSTLKSYIGLCAIAQCQKDGGVAAIIDTEHAFDSAWAEQIGVDLATLIIEHPPNGERAIDVAEMLLRRQVDLIVFDSVAATLPKSEQETALSGDKNIQPARLAALMSLALRKLTAANGKSSMLWINQTRMNVGVTFGNPEVTTGGKALPFYSSIRVSCRKAGKVTEPHETYMTSPDGKPVKKSVKKTVAQVIKLTVEKSKLDSPFSEVYFNFDMRTGQVDNLSFIINLGIEKGVVLKDGQSWYLKGSRVKTRGYEAFQAAVDQDRLMVLLGLKEAPPAKKVGSGRLLKKRAVPVKRKS